MSRYPKNIIIIGILMFLTSCSLFSDDDPERTYPKAFGFEVVTLPDFLESQPTDSLNVEVYVTEIMLASDCSGGPNVMCIGDSIIISDIKNPDEDDRRYLVGVDNPRQFQQEQRY